MKTVINLPHEVHESTCYINGLYDLLTWKGAQYDYFLLTMVGGMANFAYLKFKMASPPCMVYWGNNPKYFLRELGEIIGLTELLSEGKSFKNEFPKIKQFLDKDQPVMVGALDMYFLHYYPDLYQKEHVPIHYLLVVGYDDENEKVFVHDCSIKGVQEVSYNEFEQSLNVHVPGMSKKNTYRVFTLPERLINELELAERGFTHKAESMLKPPVNMFGIPAMHKLSKDIPTWDNEGCFNHMVAYAGLTPPLISDDLGNNDGLRFQLSRVLANLGQKYSKKQWSDAAGLFSSSGKLIIKLCTEALTFNGTACAKILDEIAATEEKAYSMLLSG
jgi:hypothetical protein